MISSEIIKKNNCPSGVRLLCALTAGLFLLSACGKTEQKSANGADAPIESDFNASGFEYCHVTESEEGYYFWERMDQNHFYPRLMFMDKESGRVVPLCNKPDCGHDNEECNAYFPSVNVGGDGMSKDHIQYYDGSLYAVGFTSDDYVTLFRIKADGSEWETSTKLYRTDYASTGHWRTPDILIEDGYVYFNDRKQKKMKLVRVPIGGGAEEVLFEGDDDAVEVQIYRIKSSEDAVFFQAYIFSDESVEHAKGGLYQYDKTDGEYRLVKTELVQPYFVWNGCVYYGSSEGICCYSIQDGTVEILADQPIEVPYITLTKKYIILCDDMVDGYLIIYDYEGTQIAVVSCDLKPTWYFGGSSDLLFAECVRDNETRLCFLDLTRPVDELQWEELKAD